MSVRRRIVAGGLALAAVALWLVRTGDPSSSAPAIVAAAAPDELASEAAPVARAAAAPAPVEREQAPTEVRRVDEASLIESVRFDPEAPCVGDDVVVHTVLRGAAAGAKVFVDGRPGAPRVIRAREVGPQRVRVLARTWGDEYERRELELPVRDCVEEPPRLRARIRATLVAERQYVLSLEASPDGELPSAIVWDLGDGATAEGASIEHRYAARADRPQSTYLVTARYVGPSGPEIARASLSHVEASGVAARTAFPVLEDEGERFVRWDPAQGIRTMRHIENALEDDVELLVAELRGHPCDGSPVEVLQVPASQVADLTALRAGESMDVAVRVPADLFEKPICQLLVSMSGPAGGRIATTTFALDTGVPDERHPIEDSELLETIRAIAAERGDGSPITAEDIAAYRAGRGAT